MFLTMQPKQYSEQQTTACKGCSKPVLFIRDEHGTLQCLDTVAPVFARIRDRDDGQPQIIRMVTAYVSHFATCPQANKFSKKKVDNE